MLLRGHRKASDSHERDLAERMFAVAFIVKMLFLRGGDSVRSVVGYNLEVSSPKLDARIDRQALLLTLRTALAWHILRCRD